MAESGAYYQGLGQAANVKPVDFGSIASAFADVEMRRREKQEIQDKEREKQQIEAYKEFGVIYEQYEPTSLQNLNVIGAEIKNKVLEKAQAYNKALKEGTMSYADYYKNNMMLKSQSEKYRSFISNIGAFAEQVQAKGDNISAETSQINELISNMLEEGVNVVEDENGNISFMSKIGSKPALVPFDMLDKITQVKDKINIYEPLETILSTTKPNVETSKNLVTTTYLTNGELNKSQKDYVSKWFKGKTDGEIYDILESMDLEAETVVGPQGFRLKNKDEAIKLAMDNYMKEAKTFLKGKDVRDEFKGGQFTSSQANIYSQIEARNETLNENEKTITNVVKNGLELTYRKAQRIPLIKLKGKNYSDVNVVKYVTGDEGFPDKVVITVPSSVQVGVNEVLEIPLTDLGEIKNMRDFLNIPGVKTNAGTNTPEANAPENNKAPR